jgi:flavodoxin
MNPAIICKSPHHGNTKKIAAAIGDILNAALYEPQGARLDEYDLVGFGSGIYYGKFHREILNFIDNLPTMDGKKAFIFSTSRLPLIPVFHRFTRKIKETLEEKGFTVIGEFSCRGYDTSGILRFIGGIHKGRPNEDDIEGAREFAKRVKEKC